MVGGGLVGCELALDLIHKGKEVEIVEALPAIGFRPRPTNAEAYKGLGAEVYEIGDCRKVANILTAIWDGYEVAHTL